MIRYYEVGGHIRDLYLNIPSKDVDYAVEADTFEEIELDIAQQGGQIYLVTPEYYTIRAKLEFGVADFVWCRKEGPYSDSRRPDYVLPGTLYDDLARRDFTMNAIARTMLGEWIDPYNGRADMDERVIKCVGNTEERMNEDALRMLRAIRFSITKSMILSFELRKFLKDRDNVQLLKYISVERIREELFKMFNHDTLKTLRVFDLYPEIEEFVWNTGLWIMPTLKER